MNKNLKTLDVDLIEKEFKELDIALSKLATSDSSVGYAPHIEKEFYNVIDKINDLKFLFNFNQIQGFDYFTKTFK